MKKLLLILPFILFVSFVNAGLAGAEYSKKEDKKISIQTGLNLSVPLNTAQKTFELQEMVHTDLNGLTGLEIDHYYYWVEIDGQQILAIDPARVMF